MMTVGIIPCRYKSLRFPGKALADIHGKPMMWHVYHQSLKASALDAVYIATDDARIRQACEEFGLEVLMTRENHPTGTDRVAECASMIEAEYYINIQGDEPMISSEAIDAVAKAIKTCKDPMVIASNAFVPINSPRAVVDSNIVKVILAMDNTALAYSRQPIPYPKGGECQYLRQLGLYTFSKRGLQIFAKHPPGRMERTEEVEMFRFLEHGYKVLMVEVDDDSIPVDTEADLERVRALMSDQIVGTR